MVPARRAAGGVTAAGGCTVLAAAAIMLAACGGQHTAAPATTSAAASSPSAHSSSSAAAVTGSVQLPAQLLGLNKNISATAKQAIPTVSQQFASPLMRDVAGGRTAIYGGQNDATPLVFVSAGMWAKHLGSPDNAAHELQEFLRTKGFTDARVLPPGPDGEALACGQRHIAPGTNTVCYWADHLTFGVAVYSSGFVSSLSDAASKTSQIRSAVVS